MRLVATLIALVLLAPGCALHRLRGSNAADGISEATVRAHMEFLAGDALNGRGSGTRDEWIAASYMAAQMRKWRLEPLGDDGGYVRTIVVQQQEVAGPPALTLGKGSWSHGTEIVVPLIGSARTSGPLHKYSPGVAVPAGAAALVAEANDKLGADTSRAAIVLLRASAAHQKMWSQLAKTVTQMPEAIEGVPTAPAPARVLVDEKVYAALEAASGAEVVLTAQLKPATTTRTWNAVGRLPGSDRILGGEAILLSAHLDHLGADTAAPSTKDAIYNGADDDASGCVAVLELMEALVRGPRPRRTVLFAWFGSEESGGAGSRYFAQNPPVPLDRIVANLQFEMIGRPDKAVAARTLWLTGYDRSTLGAELARRGARLVADPHPEQNFFERSDNIQFARRGVIAHTVSSYGLHTQYHQPTDEVRHVDFVHMTDAIRSLVAPIRWLANSSFKPAWLPGRKP